MKKYRIWVKSVSFCYLDVEAETVNDALEIADEADGGEFTDSGYGDWETMEVELMED